MESTEARPGEKLAGPAASWRNLLLLGVVSRLAVLAVGIVLCKGPVSAEDQSWRLAAVHPADLAIEAQQGAELQKPSRRPIEPWYRWDSMWYARICRLGYSRAPAGQQATTGFMPLLSIVMAAGAAAGLDPYWVGLIAPNLAFALGLAAFGRLVATATGDGVTAWRSCLLLVAYPGSLFFSAPYQESLAFALLSLAILAWLDHRPALSALALAPAGLARLTAVAFPVAIVAEWLDDLARGRRPRHSAFFVAAAGGVGIGAFFLYLGWKFGDPLLYLKTHGAWGRRPASPANLVRLASEVVHMARSAPLFGLAVASILAWTLREPIAAILTRIGRIGRGLAATTAAIAVVTALGLAVPGGDYRGKIVYLYKERDFLIAALFLGLGVRAWWRRGPFWGCLVLVPLLQALATGTVLSISRLALASFPAFLDAAELAPKRWAFAVVVGVLCLVQIRWIQLFVNFVFVG